jgi:metallophosphoesterase (TIGR00282 family)
MRILFLGDVVGRAGRDAVERELPRLRAALALDLVVVNAENASHGFGLSPDMARAFLAAGADVLTLGNHAWDRKEIIPFIEQEKRLIRPLNYPPGTPGKGAVVVEVPGNRRALVLQAMGRLFMELLDDPFRAIQAELQKHRLGGTVHAIVIDFHAEATSEKQAVAHSFDGMASLVIGTHTHVPSADHRILAGGTAFQSDTGMCGDYDSVIGMQKGTAALRFWRKVPSERLAPAESEATICGLFVETDDATGLAKRAEPLRLGGALSPIMPAP